MVEESMLNLIKKDMIQTIRQLNFENEKVQKELLDKQLSVFNSLKELHCFRKEHDVASIEEDVVIQETCLEDESHCLKKDIETDVHISEEALSVEEDDADEEDAIKKSVEEKVKLPESQVKLEESDKPMYRFERKIRGGYVKEIEGYVPEGIVRKLGLEHGDMVYATPIVSDETQRRFLYELARKGDGKDSLDRVQYNFCVVKKESGYYMVEKSEETGENITYQDAPYTIVLDQNDVREYGIKEDDLIDIAFLKDKPEMVKVIWVHRLEDKYSDKTVAENDKQEKKEKLEKKEQEEHEVFEKTLEGKTVLVIGNEPMKNLYKFSVEQRGGTFLWADAKEKLNRLEALVKKSDIVIFLLKVSGHVGMEHIKKMCKEYNVAFETTWSNGQTGLIRLAENTDATTTA